MEGNDKRKTETYRHHPGRKLAEMLNVNRRWAKLHGVSVREAYSIGIAKIEKVAQWSRKAGVRILTMWGFSGENFSRDKGEIGELFDLFRKNLMTLLTTDREERRKTRVRFFGRLNLFPKALQDLMRKVEKDTEKNTEYQLNLLLSYSGRNEIVDAVNSIIKNGIKKVDEEIISAHVYTAGLPDPDLVIRTSGEQRLSGLMPWQTVYSELYFCKKLWPDFSEKDFMAALRDYARRKRRYGK